ncbi:hypothetical protein P153DRAFT_363102 [Dothidotthia symphoricarpi CBS 119687]|uniref:Uncharacterized protein n=1 Tax=Dothidotthia symphoricarpi CBS 119687 TaxID=1392245 RepID=A0A6A6AUA2_9PLEO|nr:uncharacterized protein P153DRAFT_363102 [Dothidotthia symphoricarpi CBS 119687]KAF2134111.1 hypothetical protein P153DRAFT_363102 [Dothidotthia symphoricarpi CBS 119687]
MIRSQCENNKILADVLRFLDDAMPVELQTPLSYDPILPEVVYSVSIPMTDKDWADYQQAVSVFPRVAAFSGTLAVGEVAFDQVTAVHPTAPMLAQGVELEDLLATLVKRHSLGASWNVMKPWEKPGQDDWKYPV